MIPPEFEWLIRTEVFVARGQHPNLEPAEQIGEPELARLSVCQRRFLRLQSLVCQRQSRWSANPVTAAVRLWTCIMDPILQSTLIKTAMPSLAIIVILTVTKRRGISWGEDLGLRAPTFQSTIGWLVTWIAWIVASEIIIRTFALDQATVWPDYPLMIVVLRVVAIGLLGPFAEELVMRGMLLHVLRRTRIGAIGSIGQIAVLWAGLHYSYGAGTLALVAIDGVMFGLARYQSGSLYLPMAMHALGNSVSIYQSLST